ncbi:tetratricopeptide repeat protein [Fulvivirga lutea]|uniref:Tetratricopeptide repeat protein n=1 Tax=Fulvivirga lutea TaxID=2810512 RepID=A0A974WJT0_9BACT|nr:tetratricopeptide repeat protein [Fulvivirga lutea]QSE96663.1 tetratricopeptide repeat protein [Fulvivirga lutea]
MKRLLVVALLISAMSCKNENSNEGDVHFNQGNYEKAIESYTIYLNTEPRDIKTIYNRGRAYEELGKYALALQDFRRVIKEDPLNVNAHLSIASDYYYRLNDYENTIFYAEKVLKLDETNSTAFTLKGKAHQKLGNLQEALSAYNSAISVDKDYAEAYLSRGSLRIYGKQNSKACADFRMAKTLGVDKADELIKRYCR